MLGRSNSRFRLSNLQLLVVLEILFWIPRIYYIGLHGWSPVYLSPKTVGLAFVFDAIVLGYFFLPPALLNTLPLKNAVLVKLRNALARFYIFISFYLFAMGLVGEILFLDEFKARYNFIAVDYLVYTHEVIDNIWESYHMVWILGALCLAVFALLFYSKPLKFPKFKWASATLVVFLALAWFINQASILDGLPGNDQEFSKNTFHALFAAYRNNEIDYNRFYLKLDHDKAMALVHQEMAKDLSDKTAATPLDGRNGVFFDVKADHPEHKWNVIFVLMESMSARFMNSYGNKQILTPNLDHMIRTGVSYDNLYATGTRTVRGIEATVLGLPPTPGQSIVRRPHSDNLFSLGHVMAEHGYQNVFLYGGHALFDNMAHFFSTNGFKVIDETDFDSSEVHFSTAWGVCDEDLFNKSLKVADRLSKNGKPFFQYLLTTSNHRPYLFPPGRIQMKSGNGRLPALMYSDWAIGNFVKQARSHSWFNDTVFVFVADHNASVAGGTTIYPADYHIPFIIYAPQLLGAHRYSMMASQMDIAPTLLGYLGLSYKSRFMGHDLRKAKTERAFLATYQKLAYLTKDKMVTLSPRKEFAVFKDPSLTDWRPENKISASTDLPIVQKTIAFYQTASWLFETRKLGLEKQPVTAKRMTGERRTQ